MKIKYYFILLVLSFTFLQNCSSVKVLDSWKAEPSVVEVFKQKKVFVIARIANDAARFDFEREIADALRAKGITATESYSKAPNMNHDQDKSEEHLALVRSLIESEGFDAVVITSVKDKKETERTSSSGIYVGATYSSFYPGYYGGFNNYYSYPYNSFGGYIPMSTSTYVDTSYVLETVAYNLGEAVDNQIVAVVTTSLDNPKGAEKTAKKYVDLIVEAFEAQQ